MLSLLTSKIVLIQALISIELLCGVFYLIQWLFADYIVSKKTRANMKELGDLILISSLLLFIVTCHFQQMDPAVKVVAEGTSKVVQGICFETAHVCKALYSELAGVGKPLRVAVLGSAKSNASRQCHRI